MSSCDVLPELSPLPKERVATITKTEGIYLFRFPYNVYLCYVDLCI